MVKDNLTFKLLIEHILIGFTSLKSGKWFKRLYKTNIYLNINLDLGSEGVFARIRS